MDRVAAATHRVAIALGSNQGDRHAHLDHACARLGDLLAEFQASPRYQTAPVAASGPDFLNAAAVGVVTLAPRELLKVLLQIERERGRERPYAAAPRTLDLDLLLFDDRIVAEPGLVVPHPRFRERRFVLQPLADVAAEWRDPVTGLKIQTLLDALPRESP